MPIIRATAAAAAILLLAIGATSAQELGTNADILKPGPSEFKQIPGKPRIIDNEKQWRRDGVTFNSGSANASTALCGCPFDGNQMSRTFTGIDPRGCGYSPRKPSETMRRVIPARIVPDKEIARGRPCMTETASNGKPYDDPVAHCVASDEYVKAARNDLFNAMVEVEEIAIDIKAKKANALRPMNPTYGSCPLRVDFQNGYYDPPDAAKGKIARAWLYMIDVWNVRPFQSDVETFRKWNASFPPTNAEIDLAILISEMQGWENDYIPIPDSKRRIPKIKTDGRFLDPGKRQDEPPTQNQNAIPIIRQQTPSFPGEGTSSAPTMPRTPLLDSGKDGPKKY